MPPAAIANEVLRERGQELSEVDDALRSVHAGEGCLLVVEGEAGIGKTSLLAVAQARAAGDGMRVLSARGSELERDFAFGVVRQLFEPALYAAEAAVRERWLSGAAALARPLLDEALALGLEAEAEEEELRFRRRHGLYWLVANMAHDGPVVLSVDDVQWADEPSLGSLGHLATRVAHLPVLLVLAARTGSDPARALLADPSARMLRPAPLSIAAVRDWLTDHLESTPTRDSSRPVTGSPPATRFSWVNCCAR